MSKRQRGRRGDPEVVERPARERRRDAPADANAAMQNGCDERLGAAHRATPQSGDSTRDRPVILGRKASVTHVTGTINNSIAAVERRVNGIRPAVHTHFDLRGEGVSVKL